MPRPEVSFKEIVLEFALLIFTIGIKGNYHYSVANLSAIIIKAINIMFLKIHLDSL